MSMKRKDHKGRLLKTGESQRKDLIYQYRYTDCRGKRQTIYDADLQALRRKAKEIQNQVDDGIDYEAGQITVMELLKKYVSLKQGVRYNTRVGYNFVLNLVAKEDFGQRKISTIKVSDAKLWFMKLHRDGRGYSTITSVRGVVKPAFQMACDEDAIRKNPFTFKLTDVVPNDSKQRLALTEEQLDTWMTFIRTDKTYSKYYDEFVVLLETGMRVSEFCGLTKKDLDFENRRIHVDHQLVRERGGKYYAEATKTVSGCRYIPMTDMVYRSLKNILSHRPKVKTEPMVDGYSGFIMLDKNGNPKVALHIENEMRWAMKKYRKLYPDKPLPHITPHVFRHTFCTNFANAGMDIKNLQYLMGHSDAGVTLNVYAHASYQHAAKQMTEIKDFQSLKTRGKATDVVSVS
ncbi:MAG: site-specific integrase [Oscillospiraceae bacterium]|nr:site-specific integrase [Oscillospiraceae bacterium]